MRESIIAIISSIILLLMVFTLQTSIRSNRGAAIKAGFRGETPTLAESEIHLQADSRIVEEPVFSDDGRRLLLVYDTPSLGRRIVLWEQGLGLRDISTGNSTPLGKPAFSGDGSAALFLAENRGETTSDQRKSLFIWEDGFGSKLLIDHSFSGTWMLNFSQAAGQAVLVPASPDAAYFGKMQNTLAESNAQRNADAYTQPLLLVFRNRNDANNLSARLPRIRRGFDVFPLEQLPPVNTIALDRSQLASLNWRQNSAEAAKYQRQALKRVFTANDLDRNAAADLLVFGRGKELPIWRGFTLSGIEGAKSAAAGIHGQMTTWRVGDNQGVPVPGDYNGDGVLDLATFTPGLNSEWKGSHGNWRIYLSEPSNPPSPTREYLTLSWGHNKALPVPADYDGDGATDIAVFNPNTTKWHLLFSGGGFNTAKASLQIKGYGVVVQWGDGSDVPVPADYNGDGKADLALFEPAQAGKEAKWKLNYLSNKSGETKTNLIIDFGLHGDIPVPADYNGDGVVDIAVYRPQSLSWFIRQGNGAQKEIRWGVSNAHPFVADFDGDGFADPAFFNPQGHLRWEILPSGFTDKARSIFPHQSNVIVRLTWGDPKQLPVQVWLRDFLIHREL